MRSRSCFYKDEKALSLIDTWNLKRLSKKFAEFKVSGLPEHKPSLQAVSPGKEASVKNRLNGGCSNIGRQKPRQRPSSRDGS